MCEEEEVTEDFVCTLRRQLSEKHPRRAFVLVGSIFDAEDLERAAAQTAEMGFLLADLASPDPQQATSQPAGP